MKNWLREIVTWSGLPNVITMTRLLAIPIIAVTLGVWGQGAGAYLNAFVALVYLVAALSDLLDGHLARAYGHESNLGRFLDPLADKLLVASAIIMLIPLGRAPAWVAFLIIAREIAVTALRAIAMEKNLVIAASPQGKKKTLAQNIALFCLLWNGELIWADTVAVGTVILYVALFVTYWSGFLYFWDFFKAARELPGESPREDGLGSAQGTGPAASRDGPEASPCAALDAAQDAALSAIAAAPGASLGEASLGQAIDIAKEIKEEIKDEIKEEIKGEIRDGIVEEITEEIKEGIKEAIIEAISEGPQEGPQEGVGEPAPAAGLAAASGGASLEKPRLGQGANIAEELKE